jgi:hypothetical protein
MWPRVGSIVLIALKLKRSTSSVQTQASRKNLPRRGETNERHRRKWTDDDIGSLRNSLLKNTTHDGLVLICEIAEEVKRSIDAVAAKLSEADFFGNEEILFEKIKVTREIIASANVVTDADNDKKDVRNHAKNRKCLNCGKDFWSEWSGNRRCNACKKGESSDNWSW